MNDPILNLSAPSRQAYENWRSDCREVQREAEQLEVDGCWFLFNVHEAGEDSPPEQAKVAKAILQPGLGGGSLETITAAAASLMDWMPRVEVIRQDDKTDDSTPNGSGSTTPASLPSTHRAPTTEPDEDQSDDEAAVRMLSVFTNGLADKRFGTAARFLQDDNLTVNEKLTKIDGVIPFPPTASAKILGQLVGGVSKQAVMKTEWWIKNRKGEKENEIGRRHEKHRERATQHELHRTNDEDD